MIEVHNPQRTNNNALTGTFGVAKEPIISAGLSFADSRAAECALKASSEGLAMKAATASSGIPALVRVSVVFETGS